MKIKKNRLAKEIHEDVRRIAKERGVPITYLIHETLEKMVEQYNKDKQK